MTIPDASYVDWVEVDDYGPRPTPAGFVACEAVRITFLHGEIRCDQREGHLRWRPHYNHETGSEWT